MVTKRRTSRSCGKGRKKEVTKTSPNQERLYLKGGRNPGYVSPTSDTHKVRQGAGRPEVAGVIEDRRSLLTRRKRGRPGDRRLRPEGDKGTKCQRVGGGRNKNKSARHARAKMLDRRSDRKVKKSEEERQGRVGRMDKLVN